jgi:hypothetical protein
LTRITGKGTNTEWFFKTQCGFLYIYRVVMDTEVLENRDDQIVFEQRFVEVEQERATWEIEKVSIRDFGTLPNVAFRVIEEVFLNQVPLYLRLKQLGGLYNQIDPGVERLFERLKKMLKEYGFTDEDTEHVELVAQIEKLQGCKFHVIYRPGFGVTKITAVGDAATKFGPADLERIALGSSLLADYYIFPGAKKREGDMWSVRADDVSGLLNLYDCEVHGEVKLERGTDKILDGETMAILKIGGGEVTAVGPERSITLRPESGILHFYNPPTTASKSGKFPFVKKGWINWHATDAWASKDHLLFGTQRVSDLDMSTEYRVVPLGTEE